ncbi:MAG: carbohydrate ABC transporter permease [Chloroflexota bacterium]|nr:carbohydrate ABC transporter permease [Chloroflexota bacterium]
MATSSRRRTRLTSRTKDRASPAWAVMAWIVALIAFFPVLNMVLTGFKSEVTAVSLPPQLIFWPTLENYREVLNINFLPFFRNSLIAALTSTALVMVLAIPAAYAIALRPTKKWKDVLFFFISTRFLPPAGVIVPLFIIYREAQLLGTIHGLIILYTAMNLPIAIWMLRSFFEEVPREIIDAARVDGTGLWREITQILLPMAVPGLVATAFISIIFAWNEFFFAVSLAAIGTATVPIFLVRFVTSEGFFWAKLAASSTMAVLPIVIVGWIAQRQLVRGLSMGAIK